MGGWDKNTLFETLCISSPGSAYQMSCQVLAWWRANAQSAAAYLESEVASCRVLWGRLETVATIQGVVWGGMALFWLARNRVKVKVSH